MAKNAAYVVGTLLLLSIVVLVAAAGGAMSSVSGETPEAPTPTARVHLRIDRAGDVNCDAVTDSVDAALILQQSAGLPATLECSFHGDVSRDRVVNVIDAAVIQQWIAGLLGILSL